MVGGNNGNQFRQYAGQNVENQNGYNAVQNVRNQVVHNAVQNLGVQNGCNQNGLIVVPRITNQNPNRNGNVVAARAEVGPRRRDVAYLQTQLLIAQKEEAVIQLQAEEFDLIATTTDLDEIEEVNANYGSAEVHNYNNCYDNEIFNMFTQEEQYTELLKPIPEPHQVQQNDSNVISEVSSVEQDGRTVDQRPATVEETRAYFESLYNNLAIEVKKDEILPIVNQVDARLQNFKIQFLKEAAKFVRDFKSLAKKADESLAKHKALELEIERLLRAVENEYAKLWNDWYKKCEECKYDKISYDKAYNDMQEKIKRLQAQLGELKGKSKDTSSISNTLDPLSQKLENENVELEFQ
nr:hypothetical protein [Tanacetum cinerariifolium]